MHFSDRYSIIGYAGQIKGQAPFYSQARQIETLFSDRCAFLLHPDLLRSNVMGSPRSPRCPNMTLRQADFRWGHGVLFPHRHGENKTFTDMHVCINPSKFCVLIRVTRKTRMFVGLQATRTRKMEAVYNLQPHRYDRNKSIYPKRVSS